MAITVLFDFPNGSVEQYKQVFEKGGAPIVDQPARLHHQCFANGDGVTVVDIWEDEASFGAFGELLGPILAELGLETIPDVRRTYRTLSQSGEITDY
jgi:hypothetical protein